MSLLALSVIAIAAASVHEANRTVRIQIGEEAGPHWEDCPAEMQESTINGIEFLRQNPDATPGMQHDEWCRHKLADGWKFGEIKDGEAKTHPCLVPYADLPEEQRLKDAVFQGVARAFLPLIEASGE